MVDKSPCDCVVAMVKPVTSVTRSGYATTWTKKKNPNMTYVFSGMDAAINRALGHTNVIAHKPLLGFLAWLCWLGCPPPGDFDVYCNNVAFSHGAVEESHLHRGTDPGTGAYGSYNVKIGVTFKAWNFPWSPPWLRELPTVRYKGPERHVPYGPGAPWRRPVTVGMSWDLTESPISGDREPVLDLTESQAWDDAGTTPGVHVPQASEAATRPPRTCACLESGCACGGRPRPDMG
jgi:hypothetical protein